VESRDAAAAKDGEPNDGDARAPPWGRFFILWLCTCAACGLLPGQALFATLFADAGVFGSVCGTSSGSHDHKESKLGCKNQYVALNGVFATGSTLILMTLAPIGIIYDRWGARVVGTFGALICVVGLLLAWVSIVGAQMGLDEQTQALFVVGTLVMDFGSMLNSFSFFGLIWHFPGRQALILSLMTATYQASAFLPILFEALMRHFGFSFGNVMLSYAFVVLFVSYICWLVVPTQEEYYSEAKRQLGMPLPRPPKELKICNMLSRAVDVLRMNKRDHMISGACLCIGYNFPQIYMSMTAPYGKALFGSSEDGVRLATLYVSVNGAVGLVVAPLAATVVDLFGLGSFILFLAFILAVGSCTVGIADWSAQTATCVTMVLFNILFNLFYNRYLIMYSPPNRLGTVMGMYVIFIVIFAIPNMCIFYAWVAAGGDDADAYRIPMYASGALGSVCMTAYYGYFRTHEPPDVPHLLDDDEMELSRSFGCANLDEVMQVVHIDTRKELLKKLASSDPEVTKDLIRSIDTDAMMEMMAQRSIEDVALMMEDGVGEEDEDDDVVEGSAAVGYKELPQQSGDSREISQSPRSEAKEPLLANDESSAAESEKIVEPKTSTVELVLKPGKLGMKIMFATGDVIDVYEGRQSNNSTTFGMQAGMTAISVDGQNYSEQLLRDAIAGHQNYKVVFACTSAQAAAVKEAQAKEDTVDVVKADEPAHSSEEAAAKAEKGRISAISDKWVQLVMYSEKEKLIDLMMTQSVDDMWASTLDMEERYSDAQRKQFDKDFEKLIPGKAFAQLLRQRPELRALVMKMMKRDLDRKLGAMRRKRT